MSDLGGGLETPYPDRPKEANADLRRRAELICRDETHRRGPHRRVHHREQDASVDDPMWVEMARIDLEDGPRASGGNHLDNQQEELPEGERGGRAP